MTSLEEANLAEASSIAEFSYVVCELANEGFSKEEAKMLGVWAS